MCQSVQSLWPHSQVSCFATSFDAASQCLLQNFAPFVTAHEQAGCSQVSMSMIRAAPSEAE
jgi:hypothetical protein